MESELLQLKDVTIPRWFGTSVTSNSIVELHGFGDASPKAYGAAVYIRVTDCGTSIITASDVEIQSCTYQNSVTSKTGTCNSSDQC